MGVMKNEIKSRSNEMQNATKALNRHNRGWALVKVTGKTDGPLVWVIDGSETYPAARRELRNPVTLSSRIRSLLGLTN